MTKIIDINSYFGSWPYWSIENRDLDQVLSLCGKHGISATCISSLRAVLLDWTEGNKETLGAYRDHQEEVIPFMTVSPFWVDNPLDLLEEYYDNGMKGLRLFPSFQNYSIATYREFVELIEWANDHRLPISFSMRLFMNWGLPVANIHDIEIVAKRAPDSPIIVNGVNWGEIMAVLPLIEKYENVHFGISCLALRRGFNLLLKTAGPSRVLFGTSLPFQDPGPVLQNVTNLPVKESEVEKILGGNALRIFDHI
ncbi:MAG: amidohydrolase family protein [Candidatus Bipolaricaulota bacterium]